MMDSKTALQEAETVLQETLAKSKETEKLEEKAAKPSQEEEKAEVEALTKLLQEKEHR